jgi:alkaline phosphatase D
LKALPDVHLFDGTRRGYAVVDLDRRQAHCRLRAVSSVTQPTASVDTRATVVVDAGRPGAQLA